MTFIIILYFLLIVVFVFGLFRLPKSKIDQTLVQKKFSILIPFRNEEKNLDALLESIQNLNYNFENFEILLIDDESTDNSIAIVKKWQQTIPNIQILQNVRISNSPKKDAIQVGLKTSKFDFIITTDADCILPKDWLHCYNTTIIKTNALLVAGPIKIKNTLGLINQYQLFDSLSLLGTTMGAFGIKKPIMCNAANMGFHKQTYIETEDNNSKITSGDDIFTLEIFVRNFPSKIQYLNSVAAIVSTKAETNWKTTLQQRIRWAAKSTHYKNTFTKLVGLIVLATQLLLLISIVYQPFNAIYYWVLKICIDFVLIFTTAKKTDQTVSILKYIPIAIIYPFINTYIGIKALFGGYTWKQRSFKR